MLVEQFFIHRIGNENSPKRMERFFIEEHKKFFILLFLLETFPLLCSIIMKHETFFT